MKEYYNINELATITSLTTRTLRNHLRQGTLTGEKIDGTWTFSSEDLSAFLSVPSVRQSIKAQRNAVVLDFLADDFKSGNHACVILDYDVDDDEAQSIANFYCDCVNRQDGGIELRYGRNHRLSRVILSGGEDQIIDILNQYYSC